MPTQWKRAAAAFAVLALLAIAGSTMTTAASFTDRTQSGNNLVQAATLPAPINLTATPGNGGDTVDLDWDPAPGDFANGWDIFRFEGPCAGWTPTIIDLYGTSATTSYTDTSVSAGNTYCYAVRGTFNEWDSPISSPASATAEVTISRLYTHNAGGGSYQLTESAGTGDQPFGCLLLEAVVPLVLYVCADIDLSGDPDFGQDAYTFQSPSAYNVYGNSGWTVSLELDWFVVASLLTREIDVTAWYSAGACGAAPSSGATLIGTGSASFWNLIVLLAFGDGIFPVPLNPNPSFVEPASPVNICLETEIDTSLLGVLATVDLENGASSYIEGPFGP